VLLLCASRKRTKDEGRNCLTKEEEEEEEEEEEDVFNPALPPCVPKVNPVVVLIDNRRRRLIFVCFCFLLCGKCKEFVHPLAHTTLISPFKNKKSNKQVSGQNVYSSHVLFDKIATTRIR